MSKLEAIFEKAPWLKDSKNVIHMPIEGMNKDKDGITWKELYDMFLKLTTSSAYGKLSRNAES